MEKPDQIKLERVAKRLAESAENGHAAELTAEESLICLHVFKEYAGIGKLKERITILEEEISAIHDEQAGANL